MFKIVRKKDYERLVKERDQYRDTGRELVDLVDANMVAFDHLGRSGNDRDVKVTSRIWDRFHRLARNLY